MERIGRYEVQSKPLGQGAMGVVLLAQDPQIDRLVAIKTFEVADAPNEEEWQWLRDRLLLEGKRAGSLDHHNIVKIYDVIAEGDTAYIVMEYVSGSNLDKYLQAQGTLDQDVALRILRQTADALDYAHSKKIIHRDIKPGNLMIDDEGNVKVTDFGIAKSAGSMTQTGRLMGTPEFMAPEQVEAVSEIDGRADQFALATLAYLLLTGQKAFDVGNSATPSQKLTSLSHQILTKQPTPPSQVNPHLGRAVDAVIRKGMSKSPAGRYDSCLEFVEALDRAVFEVVPQERSRLLIPILIGALVLAALVGVALYLRKPAEVAPSISFVADQTEIPSGGQARLQWTVKDSTAVQIEPDIGAVDSSGSRDVSPERTTSYEITAIGASGGRTSVLTITVSPAVTAAVAPPKRFDPDRVAVPKGSEREPHPPPVERAVRYELSVRARDSIIAPGKVFSEEDPVLGDLGYRQLTCRVRAIGPVPKNSSFKLDWFLNGERADTAEVQPSNSGVVIPYDNKPQPGKYKVRLLSGTSERAQVTFTIQRGSEQ